MSLSLFYFLVMIFDTKREFNVVNDDFEVIYGHLNADWNWA